MDLDIQKRPIKVLMFVDRLFHGGIQTFIWNNICVLPADKVHIELLILDDGKHYTMEDDLLAKGIAIHKLNGIWIKTITDYFSYFKAANDFFVKNKDWDIVHIHASSKALPIAMAAHKYTDAVIIAHSHNTGFQTASRAKQIIGNAMKIIYKHYCDFFMGCSYEAGEWLFGKNLVKSHKFMVMPNGINFVKYKYDPILRNGIRQKYGLNDKLVLGNIARLTSQKNQEFLLKIFYEIKKINDSAILLLVGDGPDFKYLKSIVEKLKMEKSVIFAGYQTNTAAYFAAMDIFVFPSRYEGFGISLLEAQANGLRCFTSTGVTIKSNISGYVKYISLDKTPAYWAEKIMSVPFKRFDTNAISNSEYNINNAAEKLLEIYNGLLQSNGDSR